MENNQKQAETGGDRKQGKQIGKMHTDLISSPPHRQATPSPFSMRRNKAETTGNLIGLSQKFKSGALEWLDIERNPGKEEVKERTASKSL